MKQIAGYTEKDFEDDYFHYAGNNQHFVESTLIHESKVFSKQKWQNHIDIKGGEKKCVSKLGQPNFRLTDAEWMIYWIFEYKGDIYYFQCNEDKGNSIGIWVKKADKTKNWLFEPIEYNCQDSKELGEKLLEFESELAKILK